MLRREAGSARTTVQRMHLTGMRLYYCIPRCILLHSTALHFAATARILYYCTLRHATHALPHSCMCICLYMYIYLCYSCPAVLVLCRRALYSTT